MKAEIGGLAMVIGVFASMRNWLRISGIVATVYMVAGATTQVKFKVPPFWMEIQGLPLIGCASQWSC